MGHRSRLNTDRRLIAHPAMIAAPKAQSLGDLRVPMVPNVKLMNVQDDRVVILMLGDDLPQLGTALNKNEALKLGMALMTHAEALPPEPPAPEEDRRD